MVLAFDTLSYARRLQDAGVPTQEAEAHADAARAFIMAELVTKADMEVVHQQFGAIRTEFATVHAELARLREEASANKRELRGEIADVRQELRNEIIATKRDLQESMLSMRRELTALISTSELRVTVRLGSVMAVGIGILAALIKL